MIRSDLHVHTQESKRPSEWFLKKVGARESYTDVHTLYREAKKQGMDFVTVTDHNTIDGALELVDHYPDDTFISVEVTTYFPENNCKIHVLVYDLTEEQFAAIESLRRNIYQFRAFIKEQNIAYSVAHGFYSVNQKLNQSTLEKLILLFDIFESLNGARNRHYNETWQAILKSLTPERIRTLEQKYGIQPMSDDPWIKGFTGGSDDHAGIFIGETFTVSDCKKSVPDFIHTIKRKKTISQGRCNDYKSFAFSIYKIFCDYSAVAKKNAPGGIVAFVNNVVFEDHQSRLKKWVTLRKIKKGKQVKDKIILKFFEDVYNWAYNENLDSETKMARIYSSMGLLLDEFFKMLLESFVKDFSKGDIGKLFRNLMSSFPAFFISIPFFSSLRHLSQDREMILGLKNRYLGKDPMMQRKVLWFSDTTNDLNGVSVTLGNFRRQVKQRNLNVKFVTCMQKGKFTGSDPDQMMFLPCIYSLTPEFYSSYTLNFPSLLASVEMIYQYRPDRIIISTPGPVGALGMVMAGILGIDCVSIYHTDFAAQAAHIFKDEGLAGLIQSVINRFYSFSTHIKVPTTEYIHILSEQKYNPKKMSIFKRGYTPDPVNHSQSWKASFRKEHKIDEGYTLMWAGRVSKDKNMSFLIDVYAKAAQKIENLNLIICGDGPDLQEFKNRCRDEDRIHFMGYVDNRQLQDYYDISDLFVFPSTTDTFGMVILEAQAKGLYALVTDVGGPQEIIEPEKTGAILNLVSVDPWVEKIVHLHDMKQEHPETYSQIQAHCRQRIENQYNWDDALLDIIEGPNGKKGETQKHFHADPTTGVSLDRETDLVA